MRLTMTPDGPPDASAATETSRLAELYRQHAATIFRLAHRLTGSRADAEDVAQDVLRPAEVLRRHGEEAGSRRG